MISTARDAWLARRLLAVDKPVNGELAFASETFRPVAELLAATPFPDRGPLFDAVLTGRDDQDAIGRAMADFDPHGPPPDPDPDPPDGSIDPADGWEPVRLGELPPAEPFPMDVLPLPARHLAEAAAESISCPVDFPAVAILAAASGIIGRSAWLLIKPGHFASASLYAALVGGPSSGKSPALRPPWRRSSRIAGKLHDEWRPRKDAWKAAKPCERGEEPVLSRLVTSDPTTEALGPILAKNPRGLIVTPDEMTKWVMSMDQYRNGKGGDRPFYLSAWNGEPVHIDRAKHMAEPIIVPHPFLTVVGGMTPDMLSTLPEGQGRDDGFIARLLFAYPGRVARRYSERGIPDDVAAEWDRAGIWALAARDARTGRKAVPSGGHDDPASLPRVGGMVPDPLRRARRR